MSVVMVVRVVLVMEEEAEEEEEEERGGGRGKDVSVFAAQILRPARGWKVCPNGVPSHSDLPGTQHIGPAWTAAGLEMRQHGDPHRASRWRGSSGRMPLSECVITHQLALVIFGGKKKYQGGLRCSALNTCLRRERLDFAVSWVRAQIPGFPLPGN